MPVVVDTPASVAAAYAVFRHSPRAARRSPQSPANFRQADSAARRSADSPVAWRPGAHFWHDVRTPVARIFPVDTGRICLLFIHLFSRKYLKIRVYPTKQISDPNKYSILYFQNSE
jgi:hypothetical protein